jgi:D-3-phosphoglycerate dehydrogenase / 2-oxoglutarate reductase
VPGVLVLESPYANPSVEEDSLPRFDVRRLGRAELPSLAPDVVGLIVDMTTVDREVLDRLPELRCISVTGVGLDGIDLEEAERRGITVVNVPDGATEEVATHAVAMLLALVRRLSAYHRYVVGGRFRHDESGSVHRLSEQTVGILGFGRIGQAVAVRLAPFECRLLAWDPYVEPEAVRRLGVEPVSSLEELLSAADALTVHVPLTRETLALLDARRLESLKPGAVIVSTARGKVLDTAALGTLLRSGRIGGAALDVFREEPPGAELALADAADNVILTPHAAFYSIEAELEIRCRACLQLEQALAEVVHAPN